MTTYASKFERSITVASFIMHVFFSGIILWKDLVEYRQSSLVHKVQVEQFDIDLLK